VHRVLIAVYHLGMSDVPARINALADLVIDQIAAGEVIERPASIVKELLENGLDAGARDIRVIIEAGGERLIRVIDDGHGIFPEDLELALTRHCTSKLRSAEDLRALSSLGFRGEALPSIAAVARVTMQSRMVGAEFATRLVVDGGERIEGPAPCAHPLGTSVEVRDLFFNTPGRKKFLKSMRTEFHHVATLVRRLSASRFDIAIQLEHNGRTVLQLAAAKDAAQRNRRLSKLCGTSFSAQARWTEQRAGPLALSGWIGDPQTASRQSDLQYLIVNGRVVRDAYIARAIRHAYEDLLSEELQPQYLLSLDLPAEQVDVNVHPSKQEIRFREPRMVHDFVLSALKTSMPGKILSSAPVGTEAGAEILRARPQQSIGETSSARSDQVRETGSSSRYLSARVPANSSSSSPPVPTRAPGELGHVVAVVDRHFIVAAGGGQGTLVFDLASARHSMLVARLHDGFASKTLKRVPLLIPEAADIDTDLAGQIEANQALLSGCAVELGLAGPKRALLRALPAQLDRDCEPAAILTGILEGLSHKVDELAIVNAIARNAAPLPGEISISGADRLFAQLQASAARIDLDLLQFARVLDGDLAARLFE
jgi:DNA mismatch repair protein MutL